MTTSASQKSGSAETDSYADYGIKKKGTYLISMCLFMAWFYPNECHGRIVSAVSFSKTNEIAQDHTRNSAEEGDSLIGIKCKAYA